MRSKAQQRTTQDAAAARSTSVEARDFLPAFTHINAHTLVTKNGEILQTLRICKNKDGLDYEAYEGPEGALRDCIRKAITSHIPGEHIALWVHTLRKRRSVRFQAHYDHPFAAHVHAGWRAKNGWAHQYYNEVYLTLVYDGQSAQLIDKRMFKEASTTKRNRNMRNVYLESATNELDLIIAGIMDDLSKHYQVHRLQITERPAPDAAAYPRARIFYSEPMEFWSYLLNLREEQVPLPDADISDALQSCQLLFGFNALETKNDAGIKRFGALLSLKQYREVPPHTIDMLLQAPMELVISQAFHFTPGQEALESYRIQKEYFESSGDQYSIRATGIEEMEQANRKLPTDFGLQQISIMLLVDELKTLDTEISKLQKAFNGLGLVCVREDIRLEELFWSQFPANFVFLRRTSAIPTHRIAGFAKLNRFASGHTEDHFWPAPIALLPTLVHSPYFFHFHMQDNGHTLWLDCNSFNDMMSQQSLLFLLTQSQKIHPRVIYFDLHRSAELWSKKMQMPYHHLGSRETPHGLALNPFNLPQDARNLGFLSAWCSELVAASTEEKAAIKEAISDCYARTSQPDLEAFVSALRKQDAALADRFAPWLSEGTHAGFFSAQEDCLSLDQPWVGMDLTEAMSSPTHAVAAFALLLHRVILTLDGTPTIIVLQHALPILQQPFFAARLESLLEMLKENNAMMILCARLTDALPAHPLTPILLEHCASKVVVPDDIPREYVAFFPTFFSMQDQELLNRMSRMEGDILLKQGKEVVALSINLDDQPDVAAIYSNDIKTLLSAGGPFASLMEASHAPT